jgi:hypothetical protein
MSFDKENFLRTRFIRYLQQLPAQTAARWGQMNVQQMIEHFADSVKFSNGSSTNKTIVSNPDHLRKLREFLMSSKSFRENTKNPLLPAEPQPVRFSTVQAAIGNLHGELISFFQLFEISPNMTTRNPVFGDLNFEQNVQFLYKHALHHLKQFGVVPMDA